MWMGMWPPTRISAALKMCTMICTVFELTEVKHHFHQLLASLSLLRPNDDSTSRGLCEF
eukprot:m.380320 g.380320  ORF g.380320 m.380320 type:complete len:59 (+) comp28236_c1_seq1:7312-7488(+)